MMVAAAGLVGVAGRYTLQTAAAGLLPAEDRTRRCHVSLIPGRGFVKVYLPGEGRRFPAFGNLFTCGSIWRCPVCAARISARRREELSAALGAAGFEHVLITYTLRHSSADSLRRLLDALLESLRAFKSGAEWGKFARRVGWVGSVRSLEVNYGVHGWHPHLHELAFFDQAVDVGALVGFLRARWLRVLAAQGVGGDWSHALDVRYSRDDIAGYVAKFGHDPKWSAAHEVSRHVAKLARPAGGVSALGLLASAADGDSVAGARWVEYVFGMFRRHHLQWSRGLRALLGVGAEVSDGEAAADDGDESEYVPIFAAEWKKIVSAGARAQVLEFYRD